MSIVPETASADEGEVASASSGTRKIGTEKVMSDHAIIEITKRYLEEIRSNEAGHTRSPYEIAHDVAVRCNEHIGMINGGLDGMDRIPRLKTLPASSVAWILIYLHNAIRIIPATRAEDKDRPFLAVYQPDGPEAGTYDASDSAVSTLARLYAPMMKKNDVKEVIDYLRTHAPKRQQTADQDLVPLLDGIFDYKSKTLLPFDPEYVFLNKAAVRWNPDATSPVITWEEPELDADGAVKLDTFGQPIMVARNWDVESWIGSLTDDPAVERLLWQVIGAVIRPHVSWDKWVNFFSEKGNNGKGTLVALMRALLGLSGWAAISVDMFGKDFMLEPLMNATAVLTDENPVGAYLENAAPFKAAVTNDVLYINRKGLPPVSMQFWGLIVQCLNSVLTSKDKTDSFYRRQLPIPFLKWFGSKGVKRDQIKKDFVQRPEVLEFVVKHVLLDLPDYYELDEPDACLELLEEQKITGDPIREFWTEIDPQLTGDLQPSSRTYAAYVAWMALNNSSGSVVSQKALSSKLKEITDGTWELDEYAIPMGVIQPEQALNELFNRYAEKLGGKREVDRGSVSARTRKVRGFRRTAAASAAAAQRHAEVEREANELDRRYLADRDPNLKLAALEAELAEAKLAVSAAA